MKEKLLTLLDDIIDEFEEAEPENDYGFYRACQKMRTQIRRMKDDI